MYTIHKSNSDNVFDSVQNILAGNPESVMCSATVYKTLKGARAAAVRTGARIIREYFGDPTDESEFTVDYAV